MKNKLSYEFRILKKNLLVLHRKAWYQVPAGLLEGSASDQTHIEGRPALQCWTYQNKNDVTFFNLHKRKFIKLS